MTDSLWRKRQEPEQEYHAVNAVHKGQQCYVKAQPQQEPTKQEHNILMGALKRSGKVVAQTEHHTLTSRVNDVRLHKERDEQRAEAMKMLAQPEPYDQTALELCNVCGWKTLIPDDACLNCERAQPDNQCKIQTVDSSTERKAD